MKHRSCPAASLFRGVWASASLATGAPRETQLAVSDVRQESLMSIRAHGTFEVKLMPEASGADAADSSLGRLTMAKQFRGDLEGSARGQMLTAMTPVEGSA